MKRIILLYLLVYPLFSIGQKMVVDKTFGDNGKLILKYPWNEGTIEQMSLDESGKISIFGFPTKNMETNIGICKVDLMQIKDSNRVVNTKIHHFETVTGKALTELMPLTKYSSLFKTKNNQFITAGSEKINTIYGVSLYKYDDSGKLVKSFGKNGHSFIAFDTKASEILITDILVDKNNKIFVSLVHQTDFKQTYILICDQYGQLEKKELVERVKDKTFVPYRLIENNNGIILTGTTEPKEDLYATFLIKYTYAGKIDISFGEKGLVNLSKTVKGTIIPYSLATDKNENIFICNGAYKFAGNTGIIRLTKGGNLDKTFYKSGYIYLTDIPQYYNRPKISIDSDNQIYLLFSGYNFDNNKTEIYITRGKKLIK